MATYRIEIVNEETGEITEARAGIPKSVLDMLLAELPKLDVAIAAHKAKNAVTAPVRKLADLIAKRAPKKD